MSLISLFAKFTSSKRSPVIEFESEAARDAASAFLLRADTLEASSTELVTVKASLETANGSISSLTTEKATLTTQVTQLTTDLATANTALSEANGKLALFAKQGNPVAPVQTDETQSQVSPGSLRDQQLVAVSAYRKANPSATNGEAWLMVAKEKPELFPKG